MSPFGTGNPIDPDRVKPEITAIRDLANDFVWLSVLIKGIGSNILEMQDYMDEKYCDVVFDPVTHDISVTVKDRCVENAMLYDLASDRKSFIESCASQLVDEIGELHSVHNRTDWRLVSLPAPITKELRALSGVPWIPHVQRECLLHLLRWPIRIPSVDDWRRGSLSEPKPAIPNQVDKLLAYAREANPVDAWRETCEKLDGYRFDLIAISSEFGRIEQDGPSEFKKWCHEGTEYEWGKGPLSWRLASALWNARPNGLSFDELATNVWDDHAIQLSTHQVGSQRREANKFFEQHAIPMHIEVNNGSQWASLMPGLPKKKGTRAKKPE